MILVGFFVSDTETAKQTKITKNSFQYEAMPLLIEEPIKYNKEKSNAVQEEKTVIEHEKTEVVTALPIISSEKSYKTEEIHRTDEETYRTTRTVQEGTQPENFSYNGNYVEQRIPNTYQGESNVRVYINGALIQFYDAHPFIDSNDRAMLPIRVVSENLGMSVSWSHDTREVTINGRVKLTIGSDIAYVDGIAMKMNTKAVIFNNRTYVPLSFVSQIFGMQVNWNKNYLGGADIYIVDMYQQQVSRGTERTEILKPNHIYFGSKEIRYYEGGQSQGQSIIDRSPSVASTWGGTKFWSPYDNQNTHFIAHSHSAFNGLWNLVRGDTVKVTDSSGKSYSYRVVDKYIVDEFGRSISTNISYYDRITGLAGGERITLQTCHTIEGQNWIIEAVR